MFSDNLMGAVALYNYLNNLYGSPYEDNKEEKEAAVNKLLSALKHGQDPEVMFRKIEQINSMQGNYKQKIGTLIMSDFWTKTYAQTIEYKPFNMNE